MTHKYKTEKQDGSVKGLFVWKIWEYNEAARDYIFIGSCIGKEEESAVKAFDDMRAREIAYTVPCKNGAAKRFRVPGENSCEKR